MNKYERGLAAIDELFARTTAEEFERDYLAAESNLGIKVEDYLNRHNLKLVVNSQDRVEHSINVGIEWSTHNSQVSSEYQVPFSSFLTNQNCRESDSSVQQLAA